MITTIAILCFVLGLGLGVKHLEQVKIREFQKGFESGFNLYAKKKMFRNFSEFSNDSVTPEDNKTILINKPKYYEYPNIK